MNQRESRHATRLQEEEGFTYNQAQEYLAENHLNTKKYQLGFARNWLRSRNSPIENDYEGFDPEPSIEEQHTFETRNTSMNINHTITALQDFETVGVRFSDTNRVYTYKTTEKFEKGDQAVVCPNGVLKLVTVVEVHDTPQVDFGSNIEYKWIVQRVNLEAYENRITQENLMAVELRKSMAAKKRLEVKNDLVALLGEDSVSKLIGISKEE